MERCLDSGCQFDNRTDYCYENPLVLGELGSQIPSLLDALLYDKRALPSDAITTTTDSVNYSYIRASSTFLADKSIRDWPIARTEVVISQEIAKETGVIVYGVYVAKSVLLSKISDQPFASTYNIVVMPNGLVDFEVEDYGMYFKDGGFYDGAIDKRPMTFYDCHQLMETLSLLDHSRGSELVA